MAKQRKTLIKETIKLLEKKEVNLLNQIVTGRSLIAVLKQELKKYE